MSNHIVWDHYNPVHIVLGRGLLEHILELIPPGDVLLVTSHVFTRLGITEKIVDLLKDAVVVYDQVLPNPDIDFIDEASHMLKKNRLKVVIALGGGSVIDTGKAFSLSLTSEKSDYLRSVLVNGNSFLPKTSLPLVAIPTTAGTGSEVTPFATIWGHKEKRKMSLACDILYPKLAILDPILQLTLPKEETLYSALDCISHALETIWNKNSTPLSEALAIKALTYSLSAVPRVIDNPSNIIARQDLMTASTLAGFAISQNRTAVAHSISYPLTLNYSVPHGLAASFTLISIIQFLHKRNFFKPDNNLYIQILKLEEMLQSFNLNSEILKFITFEQAVEKLHEMSTPDRMDNFVCNIDQDDLYSILKNSFNS